MSTIEDRLKSYAENQGLEIEEEEAPKPSLHAFSRRVGGNVKLIQQGCVNLLDLMEQLGRMSEWADALVQRVMASEELGELTERQCDGLVKALQSSFRELQLLDVQVQFERKRKIKTPRIKTEAPMVLTVQVPQNWKIQDGPA